MLGHNLGVVGITAHDNKVASVGLDCTIRLWNVQEGTEIKCIDGGPADAWSIAFSPDGNKLATGANEGKVRVSLALLVNPFYCFFPDKRMNILDF